VIVMIYRSSDVFVEFNVLVEVSGSCDYYVGGLH